VQVSESVEVSQAIGISVQKGLEEDYSIVGTLTFVQHSYGDVILIYLLVDFL
jgi:hypothetical protein